MAAEKIEPPKAPLVWPMWRATSAFDFCAFSSRARSRIAARSSAVKPLDFALVAVRLAAFFVFLVALIEASFLLGGVVPTTRVTRNAGGM